MHCTLTVCYPLWVADHCEPRAHPVGSAADDGRRSLKCRPTGKNRRRFSWPARPFPSSTLFLASQTISIFGTSSVQSNFTIGILTVALGLVPFFWVYLAFMLLCGVSFPVFNAPSTVILQQRVEDDFRGRVFGLLGMLSGSMMPLGMLLFGPLADVVKIEWLLMGTGFLI